MNENTTITHPVRCCRCKHIHAKSDRINIQQRGEPRGFTQEVCPKCAAHSYFMVRADGKNAKDSSEWADTYQPKIPVLR